VVPVHLRSNGWSIEPNGETFNPAVHLEDAYAKRLFLRQIKLSRKDVVSHFAKSESPRAFSEHPLLQHLKPMLLENGIVLIGTLRLRLDPALGVVYERMDASPGEPDDASV
jgi:CRISPR-associated endonuclease/helicase Cas3